MGHPSAEQAAAVPRAPSERRTRAARASRRDRGGDTVKLVLVVLVMMSVISWFIIGSKLFRLERATRQSNKFLDLFWESDTGQAWTPERLEGVYGQLPSVDTSPLAKVFRAGYVELARVIGAAGSGRAAGAGELTNVERALPPANRTTAATGTARPSAASPRSW